ncbi:MAG: hypothetical protein ACWGOL_09090 [Desulfuromonadales bacterium]
MTHLFHLHMNARTSFTHFASPEPVTDEGCLNNLSSNLGIYPRGYLTGDAQVYFGPVLALSVAIALCGSVSHGALVTAGSSFLIQLGASTCFLYFLFCGEVMIRLYLVVFCGSIFWAACSVTTPSNPAVQSQLETDGIAL